MEFAGEEVVLLPGTTGTPPARDKNKIKDPKVRHLGIKLELSASRVCYDDGVQYLAEDSSFPPQRSPSPAAV